MSVSRQVYIVDDDDAVRASLEFQLEVAGYEVASFGSGIDFLRRAPNLPFGCLILDVRMPEIDGLELQTRLKELEIVFPIVMITGHGDVPLAVRAMKAGAVDFVEKPFSETTILNSISAALSAAPAQERDDATAHSARERLGSLSRREREVLEGIIAGKPNKVTAFELGLSPRTVEVHRSRVMDKMQARSVSELVRLALAAGLNIQL